MESIKTTTTATTPLSSSSSLSATIVATTGEATTITARTTTISTTTSAAAAAAAAAEATRNANATKSNGSDVELLSRPSSVLPNIMASLASSSSSSSTSSVISTGKQQQLQQQPPRQHDGEIEGNCSPTQHDPHHTMKTTDCTMSRSSSSPIYEMPVHCASSPPEHSERSSSGSNSAGTPQQFCLRWNNYQSNLTNVFDQLLQSESFVDVTLACDGQSIKAHKMVLSACSPYFQSLFFDTPCRHPIVIMKDVGWQELKTIVEFMYKGEINVSQDQIGPILRIAEMLQVRGLADVGNIETTTNSTRHNEMIKPRISPPIKCQTSHTPPAKRSQGHHHSIDFSGDAIEAAKDFLFFTEPEKKAHLHKTVPWNINTNLNSRGIIGSNLNNSRMDMCLSPLPLPLSLPLPLPLPLLPSPLPSPHTNLLQRSAKKRRWTSTDALFNPNASPLSSLIAAERAEQEQERARQRACERQHLMMTSPIPTSTTESNHHLIGCKTRTTTSAPATDSSQKTKPIGMISNSLPNQSSMHSGAPSGTPTDVPSSPHVQMSHTAHPNSDHPSQGPSPAQSITSTRPSSVLSGCGGTGSMGSGSSSGVGSNRCSTAGGNEVRESHLTSASTNVTSDTSSNARASHRFPGVSAQAAAMAAAAAVAHIDLTPPPHGSISGRSHSSPGIPLSAVAMHHHPPSLADDLEIKPGIAEMIREEERAKMLESTHAWMSSGQSIADSYQYQLQSMWQKCWNTNQSLMHHLRFRERGPLKSWRPETMAEAIFSVLKEGLSLSQAARKYDIPYPTFVLYANRVHNMLGPSIDGGPDLRPKGRGRPQRILLGIWPDEHIKGVIKTVVFRDAKDLKEEAFTHLPYGRHSPVFPFQDTGLTYSGPVGQCPNGIPPPTGEQITQEATAAAVAAVAHNFRQQMQLAAAQHQQHVDNLGHTSLFNMSPHLTGIGPGARGPSPLTCPSGPSSLILPKDSISPALSTNSNPGGGIPVIGPRHAPSPCTSAVPGVHQLPPSMAAALQMVGAPGRCETATILSQQQQQQLHQLHMQQQAALHHHQKHSHSHPHQHQQQHQHHHQQMLFGTSSIGHQSSTTSATSSMAASSQQIPTTKSSRSSISLSPERQRHGTHTGDMTLRSPFVDFGFDLGHNKITRPFTPSRLFPDDIAELVGVTPSKNHRIIQETAISNITTIPSDIVTSCVSSIITTTSVTGGTTTTTTTTTSITSNKSSSNFKLEPIITTSV